MSIMEITNLWFEYSKDKVVLRDISFKIDKSDVISILGPNGSGKSTLLKLILGLLKKTGGSIKITGNEIEDINLKNRAKLLAYVPQKHNAVFAYKVLDIVAMGRLPYSGLFCFNSKKDYTDAYEILQKLGISYLADKEFNAISGGEQQLAMICRALLQNAEILVLDEPITGLDYGNQLILLSKLKELAKSGITCIMTTHYPEHALWTSNKSILLKQGRIMAYGETEKIINSENLYNIYNKKIEIINHELNDKSIKTCVPII